jgi:malonyl-CoA O-methyltransferase
LKAEAHRPWGAREVRDAWHDFDLLAPCYERDNLMLAIEAAMGRTLLPTMVGRRVLDAGCGTGRWGQWALQEGAACLLLTDRSASMLHRARHETGNTERAFCVQADFDALPLVSGSCDCVLASLCLSYAENLEAAISQLALCLRPGGLLYFSDVHPESEPLGWRRTYALPGGGLVEPPYRIHKLEEYRLSLTHCGLDVRRWHECSINEPIRDHFERAGHLAQYRRWYGAPLLVFAVAEKKLHG